MAFGLSAGAVAAIGMVGSAVIANQGAKSANKQANKQFQSQLQAYQNSPQYLSGTKALDYVNGTPARKEFDTEEYLKARPDIASDIYWSSRPEEHYQTYGKDEPSTQNYLAMNGKKDFYKEDMIPAKQGLMDLYYQEATRAMPQGLKTATDQATNWLGTEAYGNFAKINNRIDNQLNSNYADKMQGILQRGKF